MVTKTFRGATSDLRMRKWKDTKDVIVRSVERIGEYASKDRIVIVSFDWNSCYGDI